MMIAPVALSKRGSTVHVFFKFKTPSLHKTKQRPQKQQYKKEEKKASPYTQCEMCSKIYTPQLQTMFLPTVLMNNEHT